MGPFMARRQRRRMILGVGGLIIAAVVIVLVSQRFLMERFGDVDALPSRRKEQRLYDAVSQHKLVSNPCRVRPISRRPLPCTGDRPGRRPYGWEAAPVGCGTARRRIGALRTNGLLSCAFARHHAQAAASGLRWFPGRRVSCQRTPPRVARCRAVACAPRVMEPRYHRQRGICTADAL